VTADHRNGNKPPVLEGYLPSLPETHRQLLEQEIKRGTISNTLMALYADQGVGPDDLVVVVVASLLGEVGQLFASVFDDVEGVRSEIRAADEDGYCPVWVWAAARDRARELLEATWEEALDYADNPNRKPGCALLLIVDSDDSPAASMLRPVAVRPGTLH
jgi:hypothetical protein